MCYSVYMKFIDLRKPNDKHLYFYSGIVPCDVVDGLPSSYETYLYRIGRKSDIPCDVFSRFIYTDFIKVW